MIAAVGRLVSGRGATAFHGIGQDVAVHHDGQYLVQWVHGSALDPLGDRCSCL